MPTSYETTLRQIAEEISDQATVEQHKRKAGATVAELNEIRAASYRNISKIVSHALHIPQPIIMWSAVEMIKHSMPEPS
jgi:hypothetical protein